MKFLTLGLLAIPFIVPSFAAPEFRNRENQRRDQSATAILAHGTPLRVMPLGDSITYGIGSSNGNGYRKTLRDALVARNNLVNMVGNQHNGSMVDNDVEGWPGFRIDQIHVKAKTSAPQWKPNILLVHAGTNDCIQSFRLDSITDRMRSMIEDVLVWSPDSAVVLGTLTHNTKSSVESCLLKVNERYRGLVDELQKAGKKVTLAEMRSESGPKPDQLFDSTHPNDAGYERMGNVWNSAMQVVSDKGWIINPYMNGVPGDGA